MLVIAVSGVGPGVGKSALCDGLADRLRRRGLAVARFAEADVRSRVEFGAVVERFRADGTVDGAELVEATARYLEGLDADAVVLDALIPFVPSLRAGGYSPERIRSTLDALSARVASPIVVVYLDGDPAVALHRVASREEPGWLARYAAKLASYRLVAPGADLFALARHLVAERAETVAAVADQPWHLVLVDDAVNRDADEIRHDVLSALDLAGLLGGTPVPAGALPRPARRSVPGRRRPNSPGASRRP